ncbi:hypothetical protein [Bradyrhizobium sp. AZCC 2230]|uniref:hypothetical protein n=1 Tax=Bradyrhizobium sp. AZCC 2230 TaxID=3117021 RepID=UPI002FF1BF55
MTELTAMTMAANAQPSIGTRPIYQRNADVCASNARTMHWTNQATRRQFRISKRWRRPELIARLRCRDVAPDTIKAPNLIALSLQKEGARHPPDAANGADRLDHGPHLKRS